MQVPLPAATANLYLQQRHTACADMADKNAAVELLRQVHY